MMPAAALARVRAARKRPDPASERVPWTCEERSRVLSLREHGMCCPCIAVHMAMNGYPKRTVSAIRTVTHKARKQQ